MSTKPGAVTSRLIHSSKEQTLRQYQTEAASLTCDTEGTWKKSWEDCRNVEQLCEDKLTSNAQMKLELTRVQIDERELENVLQLQRQRDAMKDHLKKMSDALGARNMTKSEAISKFNMLNEQQTANKELREHYQRLDEFNSVLSKIVDNR